MDGIKNYEKTVLLQRHTHLTFEEQGINGSMAFDSPTFDAPTFDPSDVW